MLVPCPPLLVYSFYLSIMSRRGGVGVAGQTITYVYSGYYNMVQGHPIVRVTIWPILILECLSYGIVKWEFLYGVKFHGNKKQIYSLMMSVVAMM